MDIETQLRELLLPVFGLDSINEVELTASLVQDLGADSLDFVEIIYLIDKNFGVTLKTDELIIGSDTIKVDEIFQDGILTEQGFEILRTQFPGKQSKLQAGMNRLELFSMITVQTLAEIISLKMDQGA